MGPHRLGIARCDLCALGYMLPDREWMYMGISTMVGILRSRCKSARATLLHTLDKNLYRCMSFIGCRQFSAVKRSG